MKRARVSNDESKTKPEPLVISARINSGKPESIRVLRSTKEPALGDVFRGVPVRFSTNLFQKTLRVLNISVERGKSVFHCSTDVGGDR